MRLVGKLSMASERTKVVLIVFNGETSTFVSLTHQLPASLAMCGAVERVCVL